MVQILHLMKSWFISLLFIIPVGGCHSQHKQNQKVINDELEIVSFVYHRFGDTRFPSTNISINDFEKHLQYLKQEGYQVLNLEDAVESFYKEEKVADKVIALTIDDGYQSFFSGALPLLRKYEFPATVFINTASVGNPDYMDWDQIKKLPRYGIQIGNHSHSHDHFVNSQDAEIVENFHEDLKKSHELFSQHLGYIPTVYAYPYGEFRSEMVNILKGYNYQAAVAQNSGVIYQGSNFFALPRFPMAGNLVGINKFKEKAQMKALKIEKELPENSIFEQNPPQLLIKINDPNLNLNALQCFVEGSTHCRIIPHPEKPGWYQMEAGYPLQNRRTLYTITAPSMDGSQWHWFSHLWVQPEIDE